MKSSLLNKLLPVFATLSLTTFSAPAFAYLHGFEQGDGYDIPYSKPWSDVTYYNAGQYSSPSMFQQITPDTGLWKLQNNTSGGAGGYFSSFSTRSTTLAGVTASLPYPNPYPSNLVPVYAVGRHSGGRTSEALALRNDSANGAMELDYSLDALDFGGLTPSSSNISNVMMDFYFCPNYGGISSSGANEKFIMSLKDSLGNIGLELGYDYNNNVFWRNTPNYNYTSGIVADTSAYDGFRVNIDLMNDTFSLDYLDVSTSSTVFGNIASGMLLTPMQNFTTIGWKLNDGASKNFFDDFSFKVTTKTPEPSMSLILSIGGLGWLVSSRKRSRKI